MDGRLTPQPAARDGRVVGADGSPVPDAAVAVAWGTAPTPEIARTTDAEGRFRVGLPPGRFRIEAVAPDGRKASVEVEGGPGGEIVIRLGA